ncbi:glycine zipper family protein [Blastococcus saxobsidens]|uniref:Glycine zipper family protein n=1 Tax=Blastococcus saxobsidens TaxID=138336 RepID=A0A6L9VXC0_9ACTN|nr:glycine zipper family protein [Blastococcus saxobsidens]
MEPSSSPDRPAWIASWQEGSGLAIGLALGAGLGQLLFENLAVGMGLGLALGVALDAYVKEQRRGDDTDDDGEQPAT